MDDDDDERNSEGSKNFSTDGNDIANKSGEFSTIPLKKSYVNKEAEEETSDCIEVRDEEMNDGNIEQTTSNSGKNKN